LALLAGRYSATIGPDQNATPGNWTLAIENGELVFTIQMGARSVRVRSKKSRQPRSCSARTLRVQATDPDGGPVPLATQWRHADVEEVSDSCRDRAATLTTEEWTLPASRS
jgi:hypothetical protein